MGPYDYFIVLVGVVVGLAISDLTISFHKLLAAGRRVRWHWGPPATALLGGVLVIGEFLSAWSSKTETIYFPRVLASMGLLVLLFLAMAAALPDEVPGEGIDLKAFYFNNRFHFWGLMTLFMTVQTVIVALNAANRRSANFGIFVTQDACVALVCCSLAFVRRTWWHAIWLFPFLALELLNWWNLRLG